MAKTIDYDLYNGYYIDKYRSIIDTTLELEYVEHLLGIGYKVDIHSVALDDRPTIFAVNRKDFTSNIVKNYTENISIALGNEKYTAVDFFASDKFIQLTLLKEEETIQHFADAAHIGVSLRNINKSHIEHIMIKELKSGKRHSHFVYYIMQNESLSKELTYKEASEYIKWYIDKQVGQTE